MFLQLGEYIIQTINVGCRVFWEVGGKKHSMDMDVEGLVRQHIEHQLNIILPLLHTLDGPNFQDLLNDPIGSQVVNFMMTDLEPPANSTEPQLQAWHRQQFLIAYNQLFNTNFSYPLIEAYLAIR